MKEPPRDEVERLAAWGLVAVGVALLTLPGLCTWALSGDTDLGSWFVVTAIFGGIPMIVGASVLLWGRRILRRGPSSRPAARNGGQVALGIVLILLALGAVGQCAGPLGVLGPRMTSDTAFYGYGIFGVLVFLAALVIVLGLWMILGTREPPRRGPSP